MPIARSSKALCIMLCFASLVGITPSFSHSYTSRGKSLLKHATLRRAFHTLQVPGNKPLVKPKPIIPTALQIYERSLEADDNYSYQGRQVTTSWDNGRALAVEVSHLAPEDHRIDYLSPDWIRGQIFITDGKQQWVLDSLHRNLFHRELSRSEDPTTNTAAGFQFLKSNYILSFLQSTRTFADRKAFVLSISRMSSHRLARRLWVDAATNIVLKREVYSDSGKLLVTVAFVEINFHPKFQPGYFKLSISSGKGIKVTEQPRDADINIPLDSVPVQLGHLAFALPSLEGYHLISAGLVPSSTEKKILHLRYFDGLNLLSLFEQPRIHTKQPTKVPAKMRPVRVGQYSGHISHDSHLVTLNWDTRGLNLTLMGELPEAEMQRFADIVDSGH